VTSANDEDVVFFRIAEHSGRNLLLRYKKASRYSSHSLFHVEQLGIRDRVPRGTMNEVDGWVGGK
jgi:hypothetical protein